MKMNIMESKEYHWKLVQKQEAWHLHDSTWRNIILQSHMLHTPQAVCVREGGGGLYHEYII